MKPLTIKALFSGDRFYIDHTPYPREIFVKIWDANQQGLCVGLKTGHVKSWVGGTEVVLCNDLVGCNLTEIQEKVK